MEGHVRTQSLAPCCIYYHNISLAAECGKNVPWMLKEALYRQPEVEAFVVIKGN